MHLYCRRIRERKFTRVSELEADDEYTIVDVGVGQERTGRQDFFRTWKKLVIRPERGEKKDDHKPELLRQWQTLDGMGARPARPTDTSTWAPEGRREIRAQKAGKGETEGQRKCSVNSKPSWVHCITGRVKVETKRFCQTSSAETELWKHR
ncbi:hypothetical protein TIFTF001_003531 [Ficus carica]|uniref:Uncharacterized protein n=1 Tax=Ficus carica TaxID=3494 RepID=A0AA87ZHU6_FICCA|nr:hypothetical protein TIFTF001_003531 [Ficus carica]